MVAADDGNKQVLLGVPDFACPTPTPLRLPERVGRTAVAVADRLGVVRSREVQSFEEALALVGALGHQFFAADVAAIRAAIRAFRPDVLYADLRPAALVAARLEGVPSVSSIHLTSRSNYASAPRYAEGVNKALAEVGLAPVASTLDIFDWADQRVVPGSPTLDPVPDAIHVGPFVRPQLSPRAESPNLIVAHTGAGAVSAGKWLSRMTEAFSDWDYELWIGGRGLADRDQGAIHVRAELPFDELLPNAAAFIHHGGYDTIHLGVAHAVPQITAPGRYFARQFYSAALRNAGAGVILADAELETTRLRQQVRQILRTPSMAISAAELGEELRPLGNADRVVEVLAEVASR